MDRRFVKLDDSVSNVIVMEFPYRERTYAFENNYYKKGDMLFIDLGVYRVVSDEVEAWGPGGPHRGGGDVYFLYTLDREVPSPMGATAYMLGNIFIK